MEVWRLISDTRERDGTGRAVCRAERPPALGEDRKAPDGPGTLVELTGAVMRKDSDAGQAQRSADVNNQFQ